MFPCDDRDRPKEVKCPRIVTETYRDDAGETRVRTYVRGRPLGKGGFAVVYSMQDPSTGESFAVRACRILLHTSSNALCTLLLLRLLLLLLLLLS